MFANVAILWKEMAKAVLEVSCHGKMAVTAGLVTDRPPSINPS